MKKMFLVFLLSLSLFTANSQTLADIAARADSSVVQIEVIETKNLGIGDPGKFEKAEGLGSGVLVGKDRIYILTAAHVVIDATKIQVIFTDGTTIGALIRRIDRTSDVAVLQLDKPMDHLPAATLGDSDKMRIGDDVFIIGSPLGISHSVSKGIISGKHTEYNESNNNRAMEFFQTDASINKGNSGGPMFNMKGEVVGIISSILSFSGGFEGLGFAATSSIAKEILQQKGRIWFGTDVLALSPEMCKLLNVPQDGALLVQSVTDSSPAYFMGLKGGYLYVTIADKKILLGGDYILKFDNIQLNSRENIEKLWDYLNSVDKGHRYVITIYRAGKIKKLSWILN